MEKRFALLLVFVVLFSGASVSAQTTIRVNAGGPNYTDSSGHLWSADHGFNTGSLSTCAPKATVTGTTTPALYKSSRFDAALSPELQYSFAVANGTYTVNLYFAETCSTMTAGKRVFDVKLQGVTTFSYLDIAKAVGIDHPLVKSSTVSVTGGKLTISFVHRVDNPEVSAIEILSGATVAPKITTQPVAKTVVAGQTASFTVSSTGTAPLHYQWQKNSVSLSGATSSTYITPPTTTSDSGAGYKVIVSNASGSMTSSTAWLTVTSSGTSGGTSGGTAASAPAITSQPASATISAGETHTFSVDASGSSPLAYQWRRDGVSISGATSSTYTTPPSTISDTGTQYSVHVSNSKGSVTSNEATLTVTAPSASVDVTTYHNDNGRTGQNLKETVLTPSNVNSGNFGLHKVVALDGRVDAQPLFLSGVAVANQGTHDVVYAVTEHGSVYALDAATGAVLWHVSTLRSGETNSDTHSCGQVSPEIGITSTPVIDRSRGAIYVVAMSKNSSGSYFQRLHALSISSGAELFGGPHNITASYPGTGDHSSNGTVTFDPGQYKERAGLLEINGHIYTTWASHCDVRPYTGWVMSFDASTLAPTGVLNLTPNGSEGAMWMGGAAPAADSSGNIYLLDGNGTFDTTLNSSGMPSRGDFGNCFCKISTSSGLHVADYFAVFNTASQSGSDTDLGSGAAMVLPDLSNSTGGVVHLALGAGKNGNIYVVNRDSMGKFNPDANHVYQELIGEITGAWSMGAYFHNAVYYASAGDVLKAFTITNGKLSGSPTSRASNSIAYPGATPSISANGAGEGIVWTVANGNPAVLDAYDATNVSRQLYNSNQAGSRDHFGNGNKFVTPTVAKGRVYIPTPSGIAIFGLL